MAAYAVFSAYAVAAAILSGGRGPEFWPSGPHGGYAAALFMLWRWSSRTAATGVSVALAVLAPLLWLSVAYPAEAGMLVIDRSAMLLLHHGTPYLSAAQVTSWLSYNPYLPVMTLFGLPSAAGLAGLAGNSGVWIAVGTVIPLAAAFWIAMPHRGCTVCRRDALLATAVAVASPVIGLNLAVITTDPPVLALILLALALAARPAGGPRGRSRRRPGCRPGRRVRPGKSTAWSAVPVLAAMFAARDGARSAGRFVAASAVTVVVLIAALAPAALTSLRGLDALVQNSVLFPLGLTKYKTPAESLLPGHLLTAMGTAGHVMLVGLLLAAGLGIAISLVIRPPRDVARGGLAAGHRAGPDVPARTQRPVRLLLLPARPDRLAGPDRKDPRTEDRAVRSPKHRPG